MAWFSIWLFRLNIKKNININININGTSIELKNNWNNVGRTFEGVLLTEKRYKHAEIKVFSVGLNESKNTYHDDSKDTWLNGAYINYKIPTLEKSVFDIYLFVFPVEFAFLIINLKGFIN